MPSSSTRLCSLQLALLGAVVFSLGCPQDPAPSRCQPECEAGETCFDGRCVAAPSAGCDPECPPGERCQETVCVPESGCVGAECAQAPTDGGDVRADDGGRSLDAETTADSSVPPPGDSGPRCEAGCAPLPTACQDGLDNDGDGWIDELDPDCAAGTEELGLGLAGCNDGLDNDGDGLIDANDPECTRGSDDEVLGSDPCADDCLYGAQSCAAWDANQMSWLPELDDGPGHMHHRARVYTRWLRERLMPLGGVMRGFFTDQTYTSVQNYGGVRDVPIWTGTYLATESLRYMVTGAPDAARQMRETVETIHRWWTISGDPGYLARYAAPESSPPAVLAALPPTDDEVRVGVPFEGATWRWRGSISRDQYQGVMLGYSLAYEATTDDSLRELIRTDVLAFLEVLMQRQSRRIRVTVSGAPIPVTLEVQHVVFTDDETPDGQPDILLTLNPFEVNTRGFLMFWPNPAEYLRNVPGLGWLPNVYLRSQAIQLAGMFQVGLQVTENVPGYEQRHQALRQHYDQNFGEWLGMARDWSDSNRCGGSYHGLNIAAMPLFNWARLEADPARREAIRADVLRDAFWGDVADHKNVFFAFLYAAAPPTGVDVTPIVQTHLAQLEQFRAAPNVGRAVDLRGQYPEDPQCEGLSSVAIDVGDRAPTSFVWERNPWKLVHAEEPNALYPGLDYLAAYWWGRRYGFIAEDAPGVCLQWR